MDQCFHCTARGNLRKCLLTKCTYHDLWMVEELKSRFLMYEAELPEDISDDLYSWWYNHSIVDGVRMGPRIK